jgi:hypothetical protein
MALYGQAPTTGTTDPLYAVFRDDTGVTLATVELEQPSRNFQKLEDSAIQGLDPELPGNATYFVNIEDETGEQVANWGAVYWDGTTLQPGMSGTEISPFLVDKNHTWWFRAPDDLIAANTLYELVGFDALLSMDFSNVVPKGTSLYSVNSVSVSVVESEDSPIVEPSLGNPRLSLNRMSVHIAIDTSLTSFGVFNVAVAVTNTDNQVMTRQGRLNLTNIGS